jgi:hypothetical protein
MAKRITVTVARLGIANSDTSYLERLSKRVFDAVGSHPVRFLTNSPARGVQATIDDGDNSVLCGNALAQGLKDAGGPSSGFKATEINNAGVLASIADPIVV